MSVFQHPHLTRGIVKTAKGAFLVSRGLVEAPDDIGEALGWQPVGSDDQTQPELSKSARGRTHGPAKTDHPEVASSTFDAGDRRVAETGARARRARR